jgi:hypothetical protein
VGRAVVDIVSEIVRKLELRVSCGVLFRSNVYALYSGVDRKVESGVA